MPCHSSNKHGQGPAITRVPADPGLAPLFLLCRPRPPQHRRAQVLKEGGDDDDMPAFMPFASAHFSYGRSSFVDPAAPDMTNDDCLLYNSQARAPAARCRTRAAPRPSPAYCAGRPHPELLRSALSLAHPHMSWYG